MSNATPKATLGVLQERINRRAAQRLNTQLDAAIDPLLEFVAGEHCDTSDSMMRVDGGPANLTVREAIVKLRSRLAEVLVPRYIEAETDLVLRQLQKLDEAEAAAASST
jgi:hypothetical protein